MEFINNIHPYMQIYLLGIAVLLVFFTLLTTYGIISRRFKKSILKHIFDVILVSLLSWCGVVLTIIVLFNYYRKEKSDES